MADGPRNTPPARAELRKLPQVERVAASPELSVQRSRVGRRLVTELSKAMLSHWRARIKRGEKAPSFETLVDGIKEEVRGRLSQRLSPVINATGVLLHTNLGRAPLPEAVVSHIARARGYCSLEVDLQSGARTRRAAFTEAALARVIGSQDALIVNNNAAAVLLALTALASGREVLVSRGELIEIGGGFRIPDILARSGARLVEVGTTNRTRIDDYAAALSEETALVLRVHPSNFRISGYAERPSLAELARFSKAHSLVLVKDLGGGLVGELPQAILQGRSCPEPTVLQCLKAGAELVCFSLDKLFGGPQGGAIVGSSAAVTSLRSDPLTRALRLDKLAIAALEPVIAAYEVGQQASLPLFRALAASSEELKKRVLSWQSALGTLTEKTALCPSECFVGGGSLAEFPVPSWALVIDHPDPERLCAELRQGEPAVVARIVDGKVWLDARAVFPDEDSAIIAALRRVLS